MATKNQETPCPRHEHEVVDLRFDSDELISALVAESEFAMDFGESESDCNWAQAVLTDFQSLDDILLLQEEEGLTLQPWTLTKAPAHDVDALAFDQQGQSGTYTRDARAQDSFFHPLEVADLSLSRCLASGDSYSVGEEHSPVSPAKTTPKTTATKTRAANTTATQKRKNQNRARKYKRDELKQLRVVARELEDQISGLLGSTAQNAEDNSTCRNTEALSAKKAMMQKLFWKRCAEKEKADVEKAAVEKQRLASQIDTQQQFNKQFESLVTEHGRLLMAHEDLPEVGVITAPCRIQPNLAIFNSLGGDLDAQYQRLESVWRDCGLENSTCELVHQDRLRRSTTGVYLESIQSRLVPFAASAADRVFWEFITNEVFVPTGGRLKVCKALDDILFVALNGSVEYEKQQYQFVIHAVVKRITSNHQIAIVWDASMEIGDDPALRYASAATKGGKLSSRRVIETTSTLKLYSRLASNSKCLDCREGEISMQRPGCGVLNFVTTSYLIMPKCVESAHHLICVAPRTEIIIPDNLNQWWFRFVAHVAPHAEIMNQCSSDEGDFMSLIPQECGALPLEADYASLLDLDLLLQQIGGDSDSGATSEFDTAQDESVLFEHEVSQIEIPCAVTVRATVNTSTLNQYDVVKSESVLSSYPSASVKSSQALAHPNNPDLSTMMPSKQRLCINRGAAVPRTVVPLIAKSAKRTKKDVGAPAQQKRNHNQSRKRRQEEHLYLCSKVKEQTDLLNKLLLGSVHDTENSEHCQAVSTLDSTRTQLRLVLRKSALHRILCLRRAAAQEQENLERATMENVRLRILINESNQVVSSVEEEIRKHWSAWPMDSCFDLLRPVNKVTGGFYFDRLGRELDAQYRGLDSVWESCGLAGTRHEEGVEIYQIERGESGPFLEYVYSRVLPFAPAAAARVHKSLGDTLCLSLVDSFQVQQRDCDFHMEVVLKQFVESDRVVFVWDSVLDISSSPSDNTQLTHKGWLSIQRIPVGSKHTPHTRSRAPCAMQICTRATGVNQELADGAFVIEAIKFHQRNMLMLLQIVENILMDEMLGITSSCHASDATSQILLPPCIARHMDEFSTDEGDFLSLIPPDFGAGPSDDAIAFLLDLDHLLQCIRNDNDASETAELSGCGATQDETQDVKGVPSDSSEEHPRGKRCASTSATAPSDVKKAKRVKKDIIAPAQYDRKHNQARKRQQEERRHLRIQVKELADLVNKLLLEGQLCGVKDGNNHQAPVHDLDAMETQLRLALQKSALHQILSMKRAALQEQENLKLVTVENTRLQALVSESNQVVSSVEEEIRKHWSAWPMDSCFDLLRPVNKVTGGFYFDRLGRELDAQYRGLDSVWESCGLAGTRHEEGVEIYQIERGESGPFLEYVYSRVLPFAPAAAARVSWQCIKRGVVTQTNGELKVHKSLGNTLHISVVDSFQVRQRDCDFRVQIVMKRFVESDRVVIVWDSVLDISSNLGDTAQLTETGWVSIQPISGGGKHAPDTLARAPCTLQTCARTTGVNQELADGAFVIEAIKFHRRSMLMLLQIVENILMDEMLGITSSCHASDATSQILLPPCTGVF
ncbi:hypothetical protein FI667_g9359, partial [Globisporangium splendens]